MPNSDATVPPQDANPNAAEGTAEQDPNNPALSLIMITTRNREFSRSNSFLRFCSDRELLDEMRFRGYGRPDPA